MNRFLIVFLFASIPFAALSQSNNQTQKTKNNAPVYFIDSVMVDESEIMKYNPSKIAVLTEYKSKDAIELMGDEGKNGVIYIESKQFARMRYQKYFSSKSREYAQLISSAKNDSQIPYILNDRLLTGEFDGDLSLINDSIFKELRIISKRTLRREYKFKSKTKGVYIKSAKPENLFNSEKKF